jgi:hypothetical protein
MINAMINGICAHDQIFLLEIVSIHIGKSSIEGFFAPPVPGGTHRMGGNKLYSDDAFIDALVALGAVDRNDADTPSERMAREANAREVADTVGCGSSVARTRLEQLAEEGQIRHRSIGTNASVWWVPRNSTDT